MLTPHEYIPKLADGWEVEIIYVVSHSMLCNFLS